MPTYSGEKVLDMKYSKKQFGWHLALAGLAVAAAGVILVMKAKKEEHHGCCH